MNNLTIPPKSYETEISIFGPGFGESILVHIAQNNWIIIDSCIDASKKPAPLEYLHNLGIVPSNAIKDIIVSHWHQDHIKGISTIVDACPNANFICSDALLSKELFVLAKLESNTIVDPPFKEMSKVVEILGTRKQNIKYALANQRHWNKNFVIHGKTLSSSVWSLSPSDKSVALSKAHIQNLLPKINDTQKAFTEPIPNHLAIVLLITVGNLSILLGSDLQTTTDSDTGWSAIINSTSRPQDMASFFKIPHHGSHNGDHPDIWDKMLKTNPVAGLTPLSRGKNQLPTLSDIKRLCSRTQNVFATTISNKRKAKRRPNDVEKTIKEVAWNIKSLQPSNGHIRFRFNHNTNSSQTELFGDAVLLKS